MAYIVNTTQTAVATASSYTVTLGAHATGDLLLCLLNQDRPAGTTAFTPNTAGWVMLGTGANSGANRSQWAWKIASSSSETNPNFSGENQPWIASAIVVRDAHATEPFGATPTSGVDFVRTDYNNPAGGVSNSGSLTYTEDNSLLLYSWSSDAPSGTLVYMTTDLTGTNCVDKYAVSATATHVVGCRQMGAESPRTAPTVTMRHTVATEGGNGWVIAIRSATNGALQPYVYTDFAYLRRYGNFAAQHDPATSFTYIPDFFATSGVTTLNGIGFSAVTPLTLITTTTIGSSNWGTSSCVSSGESTSGIWVGYTHTLTEINLTDKIMSLEWRSSAGVSSSITGSEGVCVGFADVNGNWVVYQLASKASGFDAVNTNISIIALGTGTTYSTYGTMDWTRTTRIAYLSHRIGSSTGAVTLHVRNLGIFTYSQLTGGGTSRPVTLSDYTNNLASWDNYKFSEAQASKQYMIKMPLQIGDGTNSTVFDATAGACEYPQAWTMVVSPTQQTRWNVPNNTMTITVKASASDNIVFSGGVFATDTKQSLTIDGASSTAATYNFVGTPISGFDVTWKTGILCKGILFTDCETVKFKGADVTNVTVQKSLSANASALFDTAGATISGTTFDLTGVTSDYHLELGISVTDITITNATFTGTPAINKVHVLATTGTITITLTDVITNLVLADVTSEGATVVIAAPANYQTVTISGGVAGTLLQIYDLTSSTELYLGSPTFPYAWTDPAVAVGDREIRLRAMYVNGATAKEFVDQTIGTCTVASPDIAFLLTQTDDTVYNTNAIDGSAVTGVEIIDGTLRVQVSTGSISWQQLYAYETYWLYTEAGIVDEGRFAQAVDVANYLWYDFKLKNVTAPSVPLVVTGGYGKDGATGTSLAMLDTSGGTIILAPDHVVPYSSGAEATVAIVQAGLTAQGYTATKAGYITAVSDANIVQVAGTTVQGTGTEQNPWGP